MDTFKEELFRVAQGFIDKAVSLSRQAALGTLQSAFVSQGSRGGDSPSMSGDPKKRRSETGVAGRSSAKRSADDLDKISQRFMVFVTDNPGLRIEQINKQIGTSTKDLALPIRKLVASGALIQDGRKRSTTYRAGSGTAGSRKKAKSTKSKSRKR